MTLLRFSSSASANEAVASTAEVHPQRTSRILRRSRSCVVLLLVVSVGLRSVSGFGLSVKTPVAYRETSIGCAFCPKDPRELQERERDADAENWSNHRRRRRSTHLISCKVANPRKYGSAIFLSLLFRLGFISFTEPCGVVQLETQQAGLTAVGGAHNVMNDWMNNMLNLPKSRLLYNIRGHLVFNTAFAFVVSMIHFLTPQHIIDDLHVSPIPHTIMAGALGLLLVFRTNAAYNRFWEARKVWGSVTNTCRSIARLGAVALGPDSQEWLEMKEYLRLFPFLLKQHLQDQRIDSELSFTCLPRDKVLALQEDPNPPLYACQLMSEIVARAYGRFSNHAEGDRHLQDYTAVSYRMELEQGLTLLVDALGKCERILTTPVPRGYSRHTSRFLTVYGMTLPVVLVPHTELFTAPVVCAVCWGLFSIEEIAYFIEQPFDPEYQQLDLGAFSAKIAGDIERMTVKSTLGSRRLRRRWCSSSTVSVSGSATPHVSGSFPSLSTDSSIHTLSTSAWLEGLNGADFGALEGVKVGVAEEGAGERSADLEDDDVV